MELRSAENALKEPIAIIGIGCRFPGSGDSPAAFWQMLNEGRDAISEVPANRYNAMNFYDTLSTKPMKSVTRWGGFVNQQISDFDAEFFDMSPREASCLDPLQRWLLEVSWEALEDGNQNPEQLRGTNVGVFIGGFTLDNNIFQFSGENRSSLEAHTATGAALTLLSARLSYFYDFKGPCFSVDTACSSSLVAVHLACQSIWNQESSIALAGGANAMFMPEHTIAESKAGMLSPDGRCKTFDASANGYVRGEGAAAIVLKSLKKAQSDGDPLYAVIRGTACNHDGYSSGITVPNGRAQETAMRAACKTARITPDQIQYVEAHGTGTPVGDPIEVHALANVLSEGRRKNDKCLIGSVKTNIGHTEATAGAAGLIKTALCLKHREIPPNLHFNTPNPDIHFKDLCVEVVQKKTKWPDSNLPPIAGVNSFGFGGTNAHIVMQAAPSNGSSKRTSPHVPGAHLLPLSANSAPSLKALVEKYIPLLSGKTEEEVRDICHTASLHRTHHKIRSLFVGKTQKGLKEELIKFGLNGTLPAGQMGPSSKAPSRLVFVFTGMGPQWWAMGRQLLQQEPIFRETVEKIDHHFTSLAGWSLIKAMNEDESTSRIGEAEVAQPANFALQVGLFMWFQALGVRPEAVVGHSAGEVAAVHAAGIVDLADAVKIICHRSRLQQTTTGQGKLLAVGLSRDDAFELIGTEYDLISVAAINSPASITLAGDELSLVRLSEKLTRKDIFNRFLKVKVPYHSHYMLPIQKELMAELADLEFKPAAIPFYSTVTGGRVESEEMNTTYWWRNVRDSVLFADATRSLLNDGHNVFMEIGPHPVLGGSIRECISAQGRNPQAAIIPTLRRFQDEWPNLVAALKEMYACGCPLNWNNLYDTQCRKVALPLYPWDRQRYWKESRASEQYRFNPTTHPLLGNRCPGPHPTWEVEIDLQRLPYLKDHCIQGTIVFPGAGFAEMAIAAARESFPPAGASAIEIEFRKALFLKTHENARLRMAVDLRGASFEIHSVPGKQDGDWTLHATGHYKREQHIKTPDRRLILEQAKGRCPSPVPPEACYTHFRSIGLEYGETFRGIGRLWQGEGEALAEIRIPDEITRQAQSYHIHPALLDLFFQVLAVSIPIEPDGQKGVVYLPVGVKNGLTYDSPQTGKWIHAVLTRQTDRFLEGDIRLCDDKGEVLVEINECRAVVLEDREPSGLKRLPQDFYEVQWRSVPVADVPPKSDSSKTKDDSWIVFADRQGVGDRLVKRLRRKGETCIRVLQADAFGKLKNDTYTVNPSDPGHLTDLFTAINETTTGTTCQIAHMWSLDIAETEDLDEASLETAERLGPVSILHTIQGLNNASGSTGWKIWLVTRGAQFIDGDDPGKMAVGQTPLWGLGRVTGHQEHPALWGGLIDLDPHGPEIDLAMLEDRLRTTGGETEVAFRNGMTYVSRIKTRQTLSIPIPQRFRPDAAYIVTGGLGALGLLVSRWMAAHGARHLILMGRSKLPPREEWPALMTDNRFHDAVTAIQEMESTGVHCRLVPMDVTDEKALANFLSSYRRNGGRPIRGLIHAAGVSRPQLLMNLKAEDMQMVHRPKAFGAWYLHRQLAGDPLDFFILFSSVSSIIATPGQGDYAAGNSFLDGLAQYRRQRGLPALSLNWGPWGEVGMATQFEDFNDYFDRRGMYPMTSAHGMEAFARIFGEDTPQAMILSANWPVLKKMNYPMGTEQKIIEDVVAESAAGAAEASVEEVDFSREILLREPREKHPQIMTEFILNAIAGVMRLNKEQRDRLSPEDPLDTIGLDSMMALEMVAAFNSQLSLDLAVVDLLKGLTATQLAIKMTEQILSELPAN